MTNPNLTEIVDPYRSDEACQREALYQRIERVKKAVSWINGKKPEDFPGSADDAFLTKAITQQALSIGGLSELLSDLGYRQKTIKNIDYLAFHGGNPWADLYSREHNSVVDLLIATEERIDDNKLYYFAVRKEKVNSFEYDFQKGYLRTNRLSLCGHVKGLADVLIIGGSGLIVSGFAGAITLGLLAVCSYANQIRSEKESSSLRFSNYLSHRNISRQKPITGTDALLSALYLPEQNDRR